MIGASLSEPHTSVTSLSTCVCIYACLLACLDRPLTVNFKWAHSNISRCPRWRVLQLSRENEREGYCQIAGLAWKRATAKTIEVEWLAARTATSELWWVWRSRDKAWYEWQAAGCSLASGMCFAWPLIHSRDPPLARGLTVELSPCPCNHSSPAGRIAACLCGHPKCNLLLAQACPRMIQHLSSLKW